MIIKPQDLVRLNPWWSNPDEIESDTKIVEALSKKPTKGYAYTSIANTILLGPRQVGKTTYLKLMIRHLIRHQVDPRRILYFSCELLENKRDIIDLLSLYDSMFSDVAGCKYVLLDEVTFAREWEAAIKYFLDTGMSENKVIYATGSSSIWLFKGFERMPGRNIRVRVFMPLTFREYVELFGSQYLKSELNEIESFNLSKLVNLKSLYDRALKLSPFINEVNALFRNYLKTGGFLKPSYELKCHSNISEETYLDYVKWIEGDLALLGRKITLLRKLMLPLIERVSTKFSYAKLAREADLRSHVTVRDYIEVLEGLLLLRVFYQTSPISKMPDYRKEKKVYFTDPFLYSVFKGYSYGVYRDYSHENESAIVEGIIGEHLARQFRDHHARVMFYVEKGETDFTILKENMKLLGVEVKWSRNVSKMDFANRHRFREKILVSMQDLEYYEEDKMLIIPAPLFLILLSKHQLYFIE